MKGPRHDPLAEDDMLCQERQTAQIEPRPEHRRPRREIDALAGQAVGRRDGRSWCRSRSWSRAKPIFLSLEGIGGGVGCGCAVGAVVGGPVDWGAVLPEPREGV